MANVLVDSSFLVALGYPRDRNHGAAIKFVSEPHSPLWIPDVALVEAIFNLRRLGGTTAAIRFGYLLINQNPAFIALRTEDFLRAMDIFRIYRDADLDFVDCCITALAERMNILNICTFDRRDFLMIRPKHAGYFDLLP